MKLKLNKLKNDSQEIINNLQATVDSLIKIAFEYQTENEKLMADIERLNKDVRCWKDDAFKECMAREELVKKTKSEAIKEFEKKLKLTFEKAINGIPRNSKGFPLKSALIHDIHLIIDEVKKEMVGDDNG